MTYDRKVANRTKNSGSCIDLAVPIRDMQRGRRAVHSKRTGYGDPRSTLGSLRADRRVMMGQVYDSSIARYGSRLS
jgi:hypothetical protein